MKKPVSWRMLSLLGLMAVFPLSARATERSDLVTGLNVIPFLVDKIAGAVTLAVVYDAADAASKADADKVKKIVDDGLEAPGGGKVSALLVSTDELGKLSRAQVAFLTVGLAPHFDEINMATSAASILTFSNDLACVHAAKCIIGVTTQPSIVVYFSKAAADAAKIEFSQTFSLLVKGS